MSRAWSIGKTDRCKYKQLLLENNNAYETNANEEAEWHNGDEIDSQ